MSSFLLVGQLWTLTAPKHQKNNAYIWQHPCPAIQQLDRSCQWRMPLQTAMHGLVG